MDKALAPWEQQCPELKEALGKVREHWAARSARPRFDGAEFADSFWLTGGLVSLCDAWVDLGYPGVNPQVQ